MQPVLVIVILASALVSLVLAVLCVVAHRRKSVGGPLRLLGARGTATTLIDPEGTVMVRGELWRARAPHLMAPHTSIRVVGTDAHLLMVEPSPETAATRS